MPKPGFTSITVPESVYNFISASYERQKPEYLKRHGIHSMSGYVGWQLEQQTKHNNTKMRFKIIAQNYNDRLVIHDTHIDRVVEIKLLKKGFAKCLFCNSDKCVHVGHAYSMPGLWRAEE